MSTLKAIEIGLTVVSIAIGTLELLGRTDAIEGPTPIERVQNAFDDGAVEADFEREREQAEEDVERQREESHRKFCEDAAERNVTPPSCD